ESAETTSDGRVFAAPSARRLAREEGIDIGSVDGSGPGGRVGERDVRAAAESETGGTDAEAEDEPESAVTQVESEGGQRATGSETATESASRERTLAAPATRKLAEDSGIDIDSVPTDEERDGEAFVTPAAVESYAEAQQAAQDADRAALAAEGQRHEERVPYRGVRRTIGEQM